MSSPPSLYTSTRAAMTAFAAIARAILPRCHRGAACTRGCWNSSPCFGGSEPVFSERNRARSAPRTCIVLAGSDAIFFMLPILASILALRAVPSIAARLGATAPISLSTSASSLLRRS